MQYKEQQDILNYEKLNDLLEDMPSFVRYLADEYRANKASSRTVLGYVRDIDTFFYFLETEKHMDRAAITTSVLESLSPLDFTAYKSFISYYRRGGRVRKNGIKASNRKLIALRQLYQFLFRMDLIGNDPTKNMTLISDKDERDAHEIDILSKNQVTDILETVSSGKGLTKNQQVYNKDNELRDTAILELMLNTGMRVSELVGINIQDVVLDENYLFITRKGHMKAQKLHFNASVREALRDYMEFGRKESETDPEALFISRRGQRITVRSVERLVDKYSKASGAGHSSPHRLRRSYGTQLQDVTGDIFAVSERLGHKSIETAKRHYVRASDQKDVENGSLDVFSSRPSDDRKYT